MIERKFICGLFTNVLRKVSGCKHFYFLSKNKIVKSQTVLKTLTFWKKIGKKLKLSNHSHFKKYSQVFLFKVTTKLFELLNSLLLFQ